MTFLVRNRLLAIAIAIALCSPAISGAQDSDSVFIRAQRLVTEGQGDAGRALVQRELDAAPTASPRFVEALFWRASLAATAADAERDYRKIIIEHPLSPRAADALLRMGQLEMARGEREQALEHFRRLVLEHPSHSQRPRASYWSAQLLFQVGVTPRACATLADAQRSAPEGDVELRNQIEYLAPRCTGVDTSAVAREARSEIRDSAARGPTTVETARPTAGAFTVQLAAFRARASADRLRGQLAARGFPVRTVQVGELWHVRVGEYATRQAAETARERMRASNVRGFVAAMEPR